MNHRTMSLAGLALVAAVAIAAPAHAQYRIQSADGSMSLNVGLLAQGQVEALQATGADTYQGNLFLRRLRVLAGGRLTDRVTLFAETDSPNLGKANAAGGKTDNAMTVQDFVLTYAVSHELRVDAGMLLVPVSHNAQQSAANLLAVDYGPYSFLASDSTFSKVGRDYGAAGRAYLFGDHLEVRAGLYQGRRTESARNPFRTAGRVVFYPYAPDSGFYYLGTSLGKRRIVGVGGSIDAQQAYRAWSVDGVAEWPVPGGDGITLQADFTRFDGSTTFALPRQDVVLAEAGWYCHRLRVSPFVQYSQRDFNDPKLADESRFVGGLAWWSNGHKVNVKASVAQLTKDKASDGLQYVVQWQLLVW